jgi:hypothetical protein
MDSRLRGNDGKRSENRFYRDKPASTFRKLMADEPGHAEHAATILQPAKMTHPPLCPSPCLRRPAIKCFWRDHRIYQALSVI